MRESLNARRTAAPGGTTGRRKYRAMVGRALMSSDFDEAWNELHDALPRGWTVGRPSYHPERRESLERPVVGVRKREWTAVAGTEEAVVAEMARCLREIAAGRQPK